MVALCVLVACGGRDSAAPATPGPDIAQSYPPFPSLYLDGVRPPNELVLHGTHEVDALLSGTTERVDGGYVMRLHHAGCGIREAEPALGTSGTPEPEACREFNRQRFTTRRQQIVTTPAGSYTIVVRNEASRRDLGFWLRSQTAGEAPRTVVSYGGIAADSEAIFEVELAPGTYVFSCPLSPSVDYLLRVTP